MLSWLAISVKPNHEFAVFASLRHDKEEVFLPTYTESVRWSDRIKETTRPLFPGYLFLRADPSEGLPVLAVYGVLQVLASNINPSPIDAEEIELIRRVAEAKLNARPCEFERGATVEIVDGSLRGLKGTVIRTPSLTRLIISVEILKRFVSIDIDPKIVLASTAYELGIK